RITDLDRWGERLDAALQGETGSAGPHAYVFAAVRHTIESCRLPPSLFHDLLSAFRQDVTVTRYASWDALLDYCRRAAKPVGRLVLRIAGTERDDADAASDAVCTALQLTNFWQDLEIDWMKGRLYLPESIWRQAGARDDDLSARRITPEWRVALREAVARTRALFADGRAVCDTVTGRLRYELRATWLGGARILDKLEASDFDVFAKRPRLTKADALSILWGALAWRAGESEGRSPDRRRVSVANEPRERREPAKRRAR